MISLDSPIWGELKHCYGSAEDIPPLLRQLIDDPSPKSSSKEPWNSLWSALCHQGDVYPASYAAVPHLIDIAIKANWPICFDFFQLPACIEIARVNKRGPEVESELKPAYLAALAKLPIAAYVHGAHPWDRDMTQSIITAIAAAKGHIDVAEAVSNFDDNLIELINSGEWLER